MSMKTYVEAIEYVLDSELDARSDLICLRPGARRALEEADRDLPLPRMGMHSVWVALGAALQGMHPVLDLRQENGAAEFLREALMELPGDAEPAMTVILCAGEGAESLPGAYVFAPKTPRQAAGFMRSALKMNRLTLLLADQTLCRGGRYSRGPRLYAPAAGRRGGRIQRGCARGRRDRGEGGLCADP